VYFSFKDREFQSGGTVDQTAMHYGLDGHLIHVESDEGKWQLSQRNRSAVTSRTAGTSTAAKPVTDGEEDEGVDAAADEGEADEGTDAHTTHEMGTDAPDDAEAGEAGPASLRNQFNFSERGSQTVQRTFKDRGLNTEPAPRHNLGGNVTQWGIFDRFAADQERKAALTRKETKAKVGQSVAVVFYYFFFLSCSFIHQTVVYTDTRSVVGGGRTKAVRGRVKPRRRLGFQWRGPCTVVCLDFLVSTRPFFRSFARSRFHAMAAAGPDDLAASRAHGCTEHL
jgi:hypothetical protein